MSIYNVSLFRNQFIDEYKAHSLEAIFQNIKEGKDKDIIEAMRLLNNPFSLDSFHDIKKYMHYFTISGLFTKTKEHMKLLYYIPVVMLEINNLDIEKLKKLKQHIRKIKYTWAVFINTEGTGLNIFVKVNSTEKNHQKIASEVADYYQKRLNEKIVNDFTSITQTCTVSYDPDTYTNYTAVVFTITPENSGNKLSTESVDGKKIEELISVLLSFTDKMESISKPDIDKFQLLAANMNRAGIEKSVALSKIMSLQLPNESEKSINSYVNEAYKNEKEYGLFTPEYFKSVISVTSEQAVKQKQGQLTPVIPEEVHRELPDLLKRCVQVFKVSREKDVFLAGAIAVLSGCFPNVKGIYDRRQTYMNLNSLIIAPPASGKGVMYYSSIITQKINKQIKSETKSNKQSVSKGEESELSQGIFIPADSSASAVKRILNANQGTGIIFDTESQTLTNTWNNEWGSYTEIVLKAFEHEPITFSRVKDADDVKTGEIPVPKLSVCLSGTPSQIPMLMKGVEDGLFSRFMYYYYRFEGDVEFKNVFDRTGVTDLTEYFNDIGEEALTLFNDVKKHSLIKVHLKNTQENKYQEHFNRLLKYVYSSVGEKSVSTIMRLGKITFRIAMLFTLLRKLEKNELASVIVCDDKDFALSLMLSEIYLEHALAVYKALPGVVKKSNEKLFWEFLPETFSYTDAIKVGKIIFDVSDKTVMNYLNKLINIRWLKQQKKNSKYYKPNVQ